MKNSVLNFIGTFVCALLFSFFLPWWSVMLAAFLVALVLPLKGHKVFIVPFTAVFVLWVITSLFLSQANDFILAEKIAELLPLKGSVLALVLVTGIVGGIAAGISAVLANQSRGLFVKTKE